MEKTTVKRLNLDSKRVKSLYESGKGTFQIAQLVGASPGTIAVMVRKMGISRGRGTRTNVTPEIEKQIIDLASRGWTISDISPKVKRCETVVRKVMKVNYLTPIKPSLGYVVTPKDEKRIIKEYRAIKNAGLVSKKLSIPVRKVYATLLENNIPWLSPLVFNKKSLYKRDPQKDRQVIECYAKKPLSISQVSKKLGFCESTIREILNKHGVPLRKTPPGTPKLKSRRFTKEQERKICREYLSGVSSSSLQLRWDAPNSLIQNILHRNGVTLRSSWAGLSYKKDRVYLRNENFREPTKTETNPQNRPYRD